MTAHQLACAYPVAILSHSKLQENSRLFLYMPEFGLYRASMQIAMANYGSSFLFPPIKGTPCRVCTLAYWNGGRGLKALAGWSRVRVGSASLYLPPYERRCCCCRGGVTTNSQINPPLALQPSHSYMVSCDAKLIIWQQLQD